MCLWLLYVLIWCHCVLNAIYYKLLYYAVKDVCKVSKSVLRRSTTCKNNLMILFQVIQQKKTYLYGLFSHFCNLMGICGASHGTNNCTNYSLKLLEFTNFWFGGIFLIKLNYTCVGNVSAFSKLDVLKNANITLNAIFIRFWYEKMSWKKVH